MAYPLSLPKANPLITLTHPRTWLWVIELHNGQDSRLTTELIDHGLKPALDTVEKQWRENWRATINSKDKSAGKGALIIVGRRDQNKFFSNGFDFERIKDDRNFFPVTNNPLLTRLLTFPIPTIAAINGHCFAGGLILSMACDYRVMTDGSTRNTWLCMNEVHFGAIWPLSFAAVLRGKFSDARLVRKIALEGHRFSPQEALASGLVDFIVKGDTEAVLARATELANTVGINAQAGVWGLIKHDIYRDVLQTIGKEQRTIDAHIEDAAAKARL